MLYMNNNQHFHFTYISSWKNHVHLCFLSFQEICAQNHICTRKSIIFNALSSFVKETVQEKVGAPPVGNWLYFLDGEPGKARNFKKNRTVEFFTNYSKRHKRFGFCKGRYLSDSVNHISLNFYLSHPVGHSFELV